MSEQQAPGHNARQQLLSIIERVENRAAAKKEIADEITEIFAEAKGVGYHIPALRAIIRARAEDPNKRAEREDSIDMYNDALGIS
jgi:uncharacterized protein (UPF0335 family)